MHSKADTENSQERLSSVIAAAWLWADTTSTLASSMETNASLEMTSEMFRDTVWIGTAVMVEVVAGS